MNNKKKLLIFHPAIGSYRIDLFNALSKSFDTAVFIEYFKPPSAIYDYNCVTNYLDEKPLTLKKLFRIGNKQLFKGYWSAIKQHNPDVVFVSEFGIDALSSILFRKFYNKNFKIVSLCDDSFHMLSSNSDFSKFHKIARKIISPRLDNIVLVEPNARDWYLQHYDKGVYFPIVSDETNVRTSYEMALPLSREYVRTYDLEGKSVFLYVGRLVEIKNVRILINAFNKASIANSKLIIVGEGNKKEELEKLSAGNLNIHFTGRLIGDSLNAWYNVADVLVLPSKMEPFGAVTNEALIGGCKVLISKNAGSKCLVEEGLNGYIIDPDDEEGLIQKLKNLHEQNQYLKDSDLSKIRKSQMPHSFHYYYSNLINDLNLDRF